MEELGWSLCLVEYKEINHFITTEELIKLNMDFIKKNKKTIHNVPDFFLFLHNTCDEDISLLTWMSR